MALINAFRHVCRSSSLAAYRVYRREDLEYAWYMVNGYSLRYLTLERLANSNALVDCSEVECVRDLSLYSSMGMSNAASRRYSNGIGCGI